MSATTPWLIRVQDPVWRNDHDYPKGFRVTGSNGAMYTALLPSGPNNDAGPINPVEDGGTHWESLKDSLSIGGSNAITAADIGAVSSTGSSVAPMAAKLQTARTLKLTGDATGSGSFDGSKDLSIATTVATMKAATADTAGTKGLVPAPAAGKQSQFLRGDGTWQTPANTDTKVTQTVTTTNDDFPVLFTATADATATKTEGARFSTKIKVNPSTGAITATSFKGAVSGNASTASSAAKLTTARTIRTNLASTSTASFDGSANVTPGVTGILPVANGGTGNDDGTVAKLTTARSVRVNLASTSAVNFDGSANITPGVTGTLGTGNGGTGRTDGKVAALATKRTIDGAQFDGSANITHYGTCSTAAGTAAKTVALSGFVLGTGAIVRVRFSNANTAANATLNVNSTGAKAIRYKNVAMPANLIEDEGTYEFVYDGTYWQLIGGGSTGGSVPVGTVVAFSGSFGGTNNRFPIDAKTKLVNTNWCLCDGTTTNGITVPDLRGRFIMGANTTYKAGSTGGSATHSHTISGTVGSTTLSVDQIASHGHQIRSGAYGLGNEGITCKDSFDHQNSNLVSDAGGSQSHTHGLSGTSSNATSLPLFYALSFIMRVA